MKSVIAEHLVKTYRNGEVKALNDLSLDVEEGTVLGVLGPNGAGKTTTVRILATLLSQTLDQQLLQVLMSLNIQTKFVSKLVYQDSMQLSMRH